MLSEERDSKILFSLLRAGLWERDADFSGLFPVSDEIWRSVFVQARRQTVAGIVYRGLEYLPDRFFPPEDTMIRWTAEVDKIERDSRKMDQTIHDIFTFFGRYGLHPVLLKGQGVAGMYERPLLRMPGDIDLYFPGKEENSFAEALIRKKGMCPERRPDGSTEYLWGNTEVEHHLSLLDLHSPFMRKYLKGLERAKGYDTLPWGAADGPDVLLPSPVLNLLLLNAHILKHAMGKGIGLRQLCDMARAYHIMRGKVDGDEIRDIYRRAGLLSWSRLLHSFLVGELGMKESDLPYREKPIPTGALMCIVMAGGNFGQYSDGLRRKPVSAWRSKLYTAKSFLCNLGFSCRYAPGEAFWIAAALIKGQFKC